MIPLSPPADSKLNNKEDMLRLKRKNGRDMEFKRSAIIQMLANEEKELAISLKPLGDEQMLKTPEEYAHAYVNRFGFKFPNDIIEFLESPAGETVKGEMSEKVTVEHNLALAEQERLRDEELMRRRLLAMFLLYAASKKEAKAHELNAFIQEQIDHQLHRTQQRNAPQPIAKTVEEDSLVKAHTITINHLESLLAKENASLREIDYLQDKGHEQDLLQQVLQSSEQELFDMLGEYHTQLDKLPTEKKEGVLQWVNKNLADLATEQEKLNRDIDDYILANKEDTPQFAELRDKLKEVQTKHANLHDFKEILSGTKVLYDATGEVTQDLTQAQYALNKDTVLKGMKGMRLAKDEHGKLLLLAPGQNLENIVDPNEKKELQNKAHQLFLKARPELEFLNTLVERNKEVIQEQLKLQLAKKPEIEANVAALQMQIKQVEESKQQRIDQLKPTITPTPKPTNAIDSLLNSIEQPQLNAGNQQNTLKPSPQDVRSRFVNLLTILKNNPSVRQVSALNQALEAIMQRNPELKTVLQNLRDFKEGDKINQNTSDLLVKLLNNKPEIISKVIAEFRQNLSKDIEKEVTNQFNPSPFNMKPY
ncbi:hypothetical protein NKV53_09110 [Legionella sp. 27cVA30]|uniref:hypothetical protein n=1 Tax=Legionella sp. 27cVA30 TaxID=2905657 RepID=UPI0020A0DDFD|nr:hypothetical protein [Legionella sp. 27cVA30]MCP0914499.1 hypothetical protein [Legionella sp. 27cVA30]